MNAELIQQLVDLGCGKLQHINLGLCPDAIEGHETRDEECPACRALVAGQALATALAGGASIPSGLPTIDQVKALDGRIIATLSTFESEVLSFYRAQGRKYGVAVSISGASDADALAKVRSPAETDAVLRRSNGLVRVMVGQSSNASCGSANRA